MRYAVKAAIGTLLLCTAAQAGGIVWEQDYEKARLRAIKEDKLLFLDFSANW